MAHAESFASAQSGRHLGAALEGALAMNDCALLVLNHETCNWHFRIAKHFEFVPEDSALSLLEHAAFDAELVAHRNANAASPSVRPLRGLRNGMDREPFGPRQRFTRDRLAVGDVRGTGTLQLLPALEQVVPLDRRDRRPDEQRLSPFDEQRPVAELLDVAETV